MKKGAGVLLIKNGKVLLVKAGPKSGQVDGTISFPGGNVEPNETEEAAAEREFIEETGLTAAKLIDFPGNYVESSLVLKVGVVDYSFKVFLTTNYTGNLRSTEETEPFWADIEEAEKMKLLGKNKQILDSALTYLGIS